LADAARFTYRGLSRTSKLPTCVLSPDDIRRLYTELDAKTMEVLTRHLDGLHRPADMEAETFEGLKQEALRDGHLTATVQGSDGEQVVTRSVDGLADTNLPEKIAWMTFDSAAAMQAQNVHLGNRFTLRLDFTEPPGFDTYNPWDQPTPNTSQLEVSGSDQTWVTAVYESTLAFFRRRQTRREWLHTSASFNVLHWLVGFPAALWIIYRLDSSIPALAAAHTAIRGALYVYVFLVVLLVFRSIIWGFRWIFPVVELHGARSFRVRATLAAVLGSLLLALVYDVLKTLLS
jgi:hypothetical protein